MACALDKNLEALCIATKLCRAKCQHDSSLFPHVLLVEGSVCWATPERYIALRSIVAKSTGRHSDVEWQAGPSQYAFCVAAWLNCLDGKHRS